MRLLNTNTFQLETYNDEECIPQYAILSHTWEKEEVLFEDLHSNPLEEELQQLKLRFEILERQLQSRTDASPLIVPNTESIAPFEEDMQKRTTKTLQFPHLRMARKKHGWVKVEGFCEEARKFGISYVWIDTCCINKESSSELSEAINSMFSWYRNAKLCIAYMPDVFTTTPRGLRTFESSKWFKRGWTLQELIAPTNVWFYMREWKFIGTRSTLAYQITRASGVNKRVLEMDGAKALPEFSVAVRLSWAASRRTTRPEDRAYSLMGLFGVHIPTIYGEGIEAAFFRLQVEIYRAIPDHSILAWGNAIYSSWKGEYFRPEIRSDSERDMELFATTPDAFELRQSIISESYERLPFKQKPSLRVMNASAYSATTHGMPLQLLLKECGPDLDCRRVYLACLACREEGSADEALTIAVLRNDSGKFLRYSKMLHRVNFDDFQPFQSSLEPIFISNPRRDFSKLRRILHTPNLGYTVIFNHQRLLESGFILCACSCTEPVEHRENGLMICNSQHRNTHPLPIMLEFESRHVGERFMAVFRFARTRRAGYTRLRTAVLQRPVLAVISEHPYPETHYSLIRGVPQEEHLSVSGEGDLMNSIIHKQLRSKRHVFISLHYWQEGNPLEITISTKSEETGNQ